MHGFCVYVRDPRIYTRNTKMTDGLVPLIVFDWCSTEKYQNGRKIHMLQTLPEAIRHISTSFLCDFSPLSIARSWHHTSIMNIFRRCFTWIFDSIPKQIKAFCLQKKAKKKGQRRKKFRAKCNGEMWYTRLACRSIYLSWVNIKFVLSVLFFFPVICQVLFVCTITGVYQQIK